MFKSAFLAAGLCLLSYPLTSSADTTTTTETTTETYGKKAGVMGEDVPLVFGPKITALGLPLPFRVGLEAKWNNLFGLSFDYNFFPSIAFSGVSIKGTGWNLAARYYPWSRAFYVGAGFGSQTVSGSQPTVILTQTRNVGVDFKSTIFSPQIGWRWVWSSGFFLGLEAGVQIPLSSTTTLVSDATAAEKLTPQYQQAEADVKKQGKAIGSQVFPQFALVQVGYFF